LIIHFNSMSELYQLVSNLREVVRKCDKSGSSDLVETQYEIGVAFKVFFARFILVQRMVNNNNANERLLSELQLLMAECAFLSANYGISRVILERFLHLFPPIDLLLCRAKILLGLLISNESRHVNGMEKMQWSMYSTVELMSALDISINPLNNDRYKFLTFNTSAALWQIVRPFLRVGRAKQFASAMKRMAHALEAKNYGDMEWRIMYLSATAMCCEDNKDIASATELVDTAIIRADVLLQTTLTEEERLRIAHKFASEEKDRIAIAFRKIEDDEMYRIQPGAVQSEGLPSKLLIDLTSRGYEEVKAMLDGAQGAKAIIEFNQRKVVELRNVQLNSLIQLYQQRILVNPSDASKFSALPQISKCVRGYCLVIIHCMMTNAIPSKDWENIFESLIVKVSQTPNNISRSETFSDMARLAWYLKLRDLAIQCNNCALEGNFVSNVLKVKTDVCVGLKILADLTSDTKEVYRRLSVKQSDGFCISKRVDGVKILESAMLASVKLESCEYLCQEICVVVWNAILPLLHPYLRQHVHKTLKNLVTILSSISSPLVMLRCEAHCELCKCEDTVNASFPALEEAIRAVNSDYGSLDQSVEVWTNKLKDGHTTVANAGISGVHIADQFMDRNRYLDVFMLPRLYQLNQRCLVYDSPSDIEGQALLWLHYAKESNFQPFIEETTTKALFLMLETLDFAYPGLNMQKSANKKMKNPNMLLVRNSVGFVDFDALLKANGPVVIEQVPICALDQLLAERDDKHFTVYTPLIHLHYKIMYSIATLGHLLGNVNIVQNAAKFLLQHFWDPSDFFLRDLVNMQIHVRYLVSDNIPLRIKSNVFDVRLRDDSDLVEVPEVDLRCLGYNCSEANEDIRALKRMVVQFLEQGVSQAVSVGDAIAAQNGVTFFFNLHVQIFRHNLYAHVIPEVFTFLVNAVAAFETLVLSSKATSRLQIDERLRLTVVEVLAGLYESRDMMSEAIEVINRAVPISSNKALTADSEYSRKKVCELLSRLMQKRSIETGGKSGQEVQNYNSNFLTIFSTIAQAEAYPQMITKDNAIVLVRKATELLECAVVDNSCELSDLSRSQEQFSQLIEMQVEGWTRLTRLRMLFGDTVGAQYAAERCLNFFALDMLDDSDRASLNPRVWRWASVCERYFGLAVADIIQPTGQDQSLQCDLRFVALDHFCLACTYATLANNDELVVEAATTAWNASVPLVGLPDKRDDLQSMYRRLLNDLVKVKVSSSSQKAIVSKLQQQLYLVMIEGYVSSQQWKTVQATISEAFDQVCTSLHKPLWLWKVIAMSKEGKITLDGIEKLKESNASLQAQVYGNLARSSCSLLHQKGFYLKAIEILASGNHCMEQVDYMLELAQWMASNGQRYEEISSLLHTALGILIPDLISDNLAKGALKGSIKRLNFKMFDQCVRGLTMQAMLEMNLNKHILKLQQAVNYLFEALNLWMETLFSLYRVQKFDMLKPEERGEIPFPPPEIPKGMNKAQTSEYLAKLSAAPPPPTYPTLESFQPPKPNFLVPPDDPILLIYWISSPDPQLAKLMETALKDRSIDIPSHQSLTSIQLSVHYWIWLGQNLRYYGHCKLALFVFAFVRMVLLYMKPMVDGTSAVLASLYYECFSLLVDIGLPSEASALPFSIPVESSSVTTSNIEVLSIGAFIENLMTRNTLHAPRTSVAQPISVFGLSVWTPIFTNEGGFDQAFFVLAIAKSLLEFGQVQQCHSLVLILEKSFLEGCDERSLLTCTSILAKIGLMNGQFDEVVSMIASRKLELDRAGNSRELAKHTELLVHAFIGLENFGEALKVSSLSLQLMDDLCFGLHDEAENNLTDISAYCALVQTYVEIDMISINGLISNGKDARPRFDDLCQRLRRSIDLVSNAVGKSSRQVVTLLSIYLTVAVNFVIAFHRDCSGSVSANVYLTWLEYNLQLCLENANLVVSIQQELSENISHSEKYWYQSVSFDKHSEERNYSPSDFDSTSEVSSLRRLVSNPILRGLAMAHFQRAYFHVVHAMFMGEHTSSTVNEKFARESMDVVQRYLHDNCHVDSSVPVDIKLTYAAKEIHECISILNDQASDKLPLDMLTDVSCVQSTVSVFKLIRVGEYDCMWEDPDSVPLNRKFSFKNESSNFQKERSTLESNENCNIESLAETILSEKASLARQTLVEQTRAIIVRSSNFNANARSSSVHFYAPPNLLQCACVALIESFGGKHPASAAMWILQLQSTNASHWLRSVWRDYCFNPISSAAASISRLEELYSHNWPIYSAMQQISAEQDLLASSCVHYQRFSFSVDPVDILRIYPANLVVLCLQFCPLQNFLYVCAGLKTPTEDSVGAPRKGPSKGVPTSPPAADYSPINDTYWVIDKVCLSESDRLLLQHLLCQHKIWLEEASKFVSTFSTATPNDCDLDYADSVYESTSYRISERALEGKFCALVNDLENVMAPILGVNSRTYKMLQFLTGRIEGATTGASSGSHLSLQLLVDKTLQLLPWEGLQITSLFSGRVCRDFSVHMMYHRLTTLAPSKEKTPTLTVSTSGINYIVDPTKDDGCASALPKSHHLSMTDSVQALLQGKINVSLFKDNMPILGAEKWKEVRTENSHLSLQDVLVSIGMTKPAFAQVDATTAKYSTAALSNSSLLLYTLGRASATLSPMELSCMDFRLLAFIGLFDLSHNELSARRQLSSDVLKTTRHISSEQSLLISAVVSLSGVGSLLVHSWSIPTKAQNRFLHMFIRNFAASSGAHAAGLNTVLASVANASRVDSQDEMKGGIYPIKTWMRLARIVYGVPNLLYSDV